MGKPDFACAKNKDADQLRDDSVADQCPCFLYTGSAISNSVCVGSGREPGRPVFSQQSPYVTYHETKTAKTDGRTCERLDWNFLIFMYEQPRPVGVVWRINIYAMLNANVDIDNAKSKNLHTPL